MNSIAKQDVHDVIGTPRRRIALKYIDREPDTTTSDVAKYVAAFENDCHIDDVTGEQRTRVYVPLIQHHMPVLDRHGVIEWDENTKDISRGPMFDVVFNAMLAVDRAVSADTASGIARLRNVIRGRA